MYYLLLAIYRNRLRFVVFNFKKVLQKPLKVVGNIIKLSRLSYIVIFRHFQEYINLFCCLNHSIVTKDIFT